MEDTKIYLITYMEGNRQYVSHGVGNNSLKNYVLPQEPVINFKPYKDDDGIYILGGD